jgi:hypothetical protein
VLFTGKIRVAALGGSIVTIAVSSSSLLQEKIILITSIDIGIIFLNLFIAL